MLLYLSLCFFITKINVIFRAKTNNVPNMVEKVRGGVEGVMAEVAGRVRGQDLLDTLVKAVLCRACTYVYLIVLITSQHLLCFGGKNIDNNLFFTLKCKTCLHIVKL